MRVDESVEALANAILKEAQDEAGQIQSDGRQKADAILKEAEQRAERERREILDRARQEAERLRSQTVATAQLKARTRQLEFREKLLERVFQAARERLPSLQKRSDYEKVAAFLLREAVTQLNAKEAIVRADAATEKKLDGAMDELAKDLEFKPSSLEPLKQGLGVVVETADGHLTYDNTLETRLDRLKNSLRSPVYQVLMGEKL